MWLSLLPVLCMKVFIFLELWTDQLSFYVINLKGVNPSLTSVNTAFFRVFWKSYTVFQQQSLDRSCKESCSILLSRWALSDCWVSVHDLRTVETKFKGSKNKRSFWFHSEPSTKKKHPQTVMLLPLCTVFLGWWAVLINLVFQMTADDSFHCRFERHISHQLIYSSLWVESPPCANHPPLHRVPTWT